MGRRPSDLMRRTAHNFCGAAIGRGCAVAAPIFAGCLEAQSLRRVAQSQAHRVPQGRRSSLLLH
eukprot:9937814-Alexandrium_andersonii.AAC.1